MTYTILGRDSAAGEVGMAVQSKFPGVGSIIAHGRAGVGTVATQAFANPDHGPDGLELMALGATADEALDILLRGDDNRGERQIALLDAAGTAAAFTGEAVLGWDGWSGDARREDCLAIGNGLVGAGVVEAMGNAFAHVEGDLATRLIAALEAGEEAGGELRGQQSAALLVVKEGGGYGGRGGRHVDISVYDHAAPIVELRRCFALHRLSYFPSDPADLIPIDAGIAGELREILAAEGYLSEHRDGPWGEADIAAFARFMGVENYDNRIRNDALIDTEVLADIRGKRG